MFNKSLFFFLLNAYNGRPYERPNGKEICRDGFEMDTRPTLKGSKLRTLFPFLYKVNMLGKLAYDNILLSFRYIAIMTEGKKRVTRQREKER